MLYELINTTHIQIKVFRKTCKYSRWKVKEIVLSPKSALLLSVWFLSKKLSCISRLQIFIKANFNLRNKKSSNEVLVTRQSLVLHLRLLWWSARHRTRVRQWIVRLASVSYLPLFRRGREASLMNRKRICTFINLRFICEMVVWDFKIIYFNYKYFSLYIVRSLFW